MKFKYRVNEYVSLVADTGKTDDDYLLTEEKGLSARTFFTLFRETEASLIAIGSFYLTPMPDCCGIVVSGGTYLKPDTRGQGLSDAFRSLKDALAKELGYSVMIATTQMSNIPAVGNFLKSKYKVPLTFINKRTSNLLALGYKELK